MCYNANFGPQPRFQTVYFLPYGAQLRSFTTASFQILSKLDFVAAVSFVFRFAQLLGTESRKGNELDTLQRNSMQSKGRLLQKIITDILIVAQFRDFTLHQFLRRATDATWDGFDGTKMRVKIETAEYFPPVKMPILMAKFHKIVIGIVV